MKHSLIACALALTASLSATTIAAEPDNHKGLQARDMEHMTQELGLTEQQQEQIANLNSKYAERYREMRQSHREEVGRLLNAEQQVKMATLREERRERMIKRHAEYKRGDQAQRDHR